MNSDGDSFIKENYVKINNTNLPAAETAEIIAERFEFPGVSGS